MKEKKFTVLHGKQILYTDLAIMCNTSYNTIKDWLEKKKLSPEECLVKKKQPYRQRDDSANEEYISERLNKQQRKTMREFEEILSKPYNNKYMR